jgi:RNA polymerase sigma-70 factor (ECF subfamily)
MPDEASDHEIDLSRLEDIATEWGLLDQAHGTAAESAGAARNALVMRYARAIRNFVGALVPDPQDADEVAQEVLVRLLRGQFAAASPERGRFRHMLAVAAHNLVRNYWQRKRRQAGVTFDLSNLAEEPSREVEAEAAATWRQSMLDLAWKALAEYEQATPGCVSWTVLRLRADFPADDSEQLATRVSEKTGRPFRPDAVRQQLRRARVRFAQALLEEVARGLDEPTPERIEEELIEVGLMEYVQDFLPADWPTRRRHDDQA